MENRKPENVTWPRKRDHENPYAKGLYYLKIDSIAKTSENLRWFLSIAVLNGMPVISRKYQLRYVKIYTSLRYLGE